MGRFLDTAFAAACALVFCAVVGNAVLAKAGVVEAPEVSELEGRSYRAFPEATARSLADGSFQDGFEQWAADRVPRRNGVLLANAKLQRSFIAAANAPFGFPAYHTYFGSGYAWVPGRDAVVECPRDGGEAAIGPYGQAASAISRAVGRHPGRRWAFCLVDRSSTSAGNPVHALVSRPLDYAALESAFAAELPDACRLVDLSYPDGDEFFDGYFSTDHHWKAGAGYSAYREIASALGRPSAAPPPEETVFAGPFWGSEARNGACPEGEGDAVPDIVLPLDGVRVSVDGKGRGAGAVDYAASGKGAYRKPGRFSNCYAELFHGDYGLLELEREDGGGESLLIVGDSFTNCMERFFLQSYRRVACVDPRHYDGTLDGLLAAGGYDDVAVVMSANNLYGDRVCEFFG